MQQARQRPGAVRQVALDFAVFVSGLAAIGASGWGNGDLAEIVDTCADGVFQELDYRIEARNAAEFRASMDFLGYVDVPTTLHEYSKGARVLVTEWVMGRHLEALSTEEGLRMTYMAVEAVTASLVVTGIVHADPHEGNVMLADDGRLVFLDFGLMSKVRPEIMEAFACGIQAVLNRDYDELVQAFIATGFVGSPIEYRSDVDGDFGAGDARPQRDADDGPLLHKLTAPKKNVPKVYEVTCKHPVTQAMCDKLRKGVVLDDDPAPVAAHAAERVWPDGAPADAPTETLHLRLTLLQGKYHQVKRMVAAVGNRVEGLHRSSIGRLALPADLAPGQWRWVEDPAIVLP